MPMSRQNGATFSTNQIVKKLLHKKRQNNELTKNHQMVSETLLFLKVLASSLSDQLCCIIYAVTKKNIIWFLWV